MGVQVAFEPVTRDVQQAALGLARAAMADAAMLDSVRTTTQNGRDQEQHSQSD
jgi:hypothetical protein